MCWYEVVIFAADVVGRKLMCVDDSGVVCGCGEVVYETCSHFACPLYTFSSCQEADAKDVRSASLCAPNILRIRFLYELTFRSNGGRRLLDGIVIQRKAVAFR